jgi:arylsulfatase A-like enzyme
MKSIIAILVISVVQFYSSPTCNAQEEKRPNIIFIVADDLGYGDLSYLGAKDIRTPNIDRLASTGMKMTNFYANSTVCSPSRASLLSGYYPDMVGVPGVIRQVKKDSWGHLKEDLVLLPSVLKSNGYATAMIGKWHLGFEKPNTPNYKGFDHFKGFLGDMMDDYYTHLRGGVNWMRENGKEINPVGHATDIFTGWAEEYFEERKKSEVPFFLYLAYNAPHFPIQPPAEFLATVKSREKNIGVDRAMNAALVEHLDHAIGRVIKSLADNGLSENTVIVFVSDNGGSLPHAQSNGSLRGGKQDMFEGGIKIPAIIYWKNKIKAGGVMSNQSLLMDLFPTICEMVGIKNNISIDGRSFLPAIFDSKYVEESRYVYWVRREGNKYNGLCYYAARLGNFKILQNSPSEPYLFFDLEKDPLEKNPLDAKGSLVYDDLVMHLKAHIKRTEGVPWQKL